MCGAMAFGSAILLFPVTCLRDEEQFKYRAELRQKRAEAKKRREERRKLGKYTAFFNKPRLVFIRCCYENPLSKEFCGTRLFFFIIFFVFISISTFERLVNLFS